jgi:hypothetical protein
MSAISCPSILATTRAPRKTTVRTGHDGPIDEDEAQPRRPADDRPRVYWLDAQTLAIDWFERVTVEKCEFALREAERLAEQQVPARFFSDTSGATNYDVAIRRSAAAILSLVRTLGVLELVAVVESAPIRMFAATMAFVTGLRMQAFANRRDALAYLRRVKHPGVS